MPQDEESSIKLYIMLTLIFLTFYVVLSALLQHKKYPVHRSTVAILVGIAAGLFLHLAAPETYIALAKIDEVIIFEVLLPPILFAQGFTLHKSAFFRNIKYILTFGLLGTFLSFMVSWALIYQASSLDLVRDAQDVNNFRVLSDWEILLLAACLCSIDPGASEEQVSSVKFPRLYSVIYGEDILKDAITIVLFQSILNLQSKERYDKLVVYWYTFFQMMLNFIVLILGSVAAAFVSAFFATFLSKKMRFLTNDKGVSQTGFLFLLGFFTYIHTELLGFSGSLSVLLYGVLLNHYNIYNMSEQSRHVSTSTFILLSNISEGLLFLIMGIMVWQGQWESSKSENDKMTHSYIFFMVVLVILVIARFVNVYVLGFICRLVTKRKFSFSLQEMNILFLGGIVRGAIPFILFSSISFTNTERYAKNQGMVLKTTIIFVIIFTSVILNSIIPIFYRKRVKKLKNEYRKILGSVEERKESGEKKKGKVKQFQERFIKKLLIVDYEARRVEIQEEKRKRKEELTAESLEEEHSEELLTEDDKNSVC